MEKIWNAVVSCHPFLLVHLDVYGMLCKSQITCISILFNSGMLRNVTAIKTKTGPTQSLRIFTTLISLTRLNGIQCVFIIR